MQKSVLSTAVHNVIEGKEPVTLTTNKDAQLDPNDFDQVMFLEDQDPQRWEDLDSLFTTIGTELMTLTKSVHEMVTNESIVSSLKEKQNIFLENAQRFFKDIEVTSTKLADVHDLHKDKIGIIKSSDDFHDYNEIFFKYKNISDQGMAIVSTTLIDLTLMATESNQEESDAVNQVQDAEFTETPTEEPTEKTGE